MKVNNSKVHAGAIVKSYRYGNTLELTTSNGIHKQTIKVLPNKKYVVLETGEIFDMDTSGETRSDNIKSTRITMRKLRRLITHNFNGDKNELWITLTYAKYTNEIEIVYRDFKLFIRDLRKQYSDLEYINVIEPQASGSWHCHLLIKAPKRSSLYIPNKIIEECWKKGFTKTKRLKNSDKAGNYVVAYLTNLEIDDDQNTKKYVKGARLYLYPKGVRIYRCSRGIKKPIEITATKGEVMSINGLDIDLDANYSKKTNHIISTGDEISYITEFYNIGDKNEDS